MATPDFNKRLDTIRRMLPATGMVVVGGCSIGTIAQYGEWNIAQLLIIEADEERAERLSAFIQGRDGWEVKAALVTDHEGHANHYLASNPNESGLLQPEKLRQLWQNLKTLETRQRHCTTLDTLLTHFHNDSNRPNWMTIDCLPALPVLQGASRTLASMDLLCVRAILEDEPYYGLGATKTELDTFLSAKGFSFLTCEEELQPAVGRLIYVRDFKKLLIRERIDRQQQIEQLTKAHDEQTKLAGDRQAQLEQLAQARDEQATLAEERHLLLDAAAKEKADLTAARDQQAKLAADRQQQIEQLTKARDEQTKLAGDRQAQLEQLAQARDEQATLAEERRLLLDAAAKEKADLTAARDQQAKLAADRQQQIEQLTKARDEQTKLAGDRQAEINKLKTSLQEVENKKSQLETKLAEYDQRQHLMNEELVRAEGQIDLIKDLLLREPGL